jgi:hypothetical protein
MKSYGSKVVVSPASSVAWTSAKLFEEAVTCLAEPPAKGVPDIYKLHCNE